MIVSEQQAFLPPNNGTCACLNQNLTYTCVVDGAGTTVWSGTSFACPTQDDMEVTLRHSSFNEGTAFGQCNEGSVTVQAVNVTANRFYTSELIANVTNELDGSNVSCLLSSGRGRITVGGARIIVARGNYNGITIVNVFEYVMDQLGGWHKYTLIFSGKKPVSYIHVVVRSFCTCIA